MKGSADLVIFIILTLTLHGSLQQQGPDPSFCNTLQHYNSPSVTCCAREKYAPANLDIFGNDAATTACLNDGDVQSADSLIKKTWLFYGCMVNNRLQGKELTFDSFTDLMTERFPDNVKNAIKQRMEEIKAHIKKKEKEKGEKESATRRRRKRYLTRVKREETGENEETPSEPQDAGNGADAPAEPEGEAPAEPEGEVPAEPEGEAPAEPEGEAPAEPEGEAPAEPEGETPAEPEGETPAEPEGEAPAEPEGESPAEPGDETPAEPEGEAPVEPEGEAPAAPEGEAPAEPEGEAPAEPEGEAPAEPEGEAPAEPEGESPAEPEGETPAESEGETPAEPEGEAPAEPEGESPAEPEGEAPAEPEGEAPAEPEGETPAEPEGEAPAEPEGESPAEPEGETPAEPEGEAPAEPEGESPAEPEGEAPAEPEGEAPAEPEGEVPAEPEGEAPAEPEPAPEPGQDDQSPKVPMHIPAYEYISAYEYFDKFEKLIPDENLFRIWDAYYVAEFDACQNISGTLENVTKTFYANRCFSWIHRSARSGDCCGPAPIPVPLLHEPELEMEAVQNNTAHNIFSITGTYTWTNLSYSYNIDKCNKYSTAVLLNKASLEDLKQGIEEFLEYNGTKGPDYDKIVRDMLPTFYPRNLVDTVIKHVFAKPDSGENWDDYYFKIDIDTDTSGDIRKIKDMHSPLYEWAWDHEWEKNKIDVNRTRYIFWTCDAYRMISQRIKYFDTTPFC